MDIVEKFCGIPVPDWGDFIHLKGKIFHGGTVRRRAGRPEVAPAGFSGLQTKGFPGTPGRRESRHQERDFGFVPIRGGGRLAEPTAAGWSIGGVIKSIRDNGRSYVVETDGGAAYLRNRRYIKASTATARRNVVGASLAAVDKGKKREGVRFKLMVRFEKPGSKD